MPDPVQPVRFRDPSAVPPGGRYFYDIETSNGPVHFEAPDMPQLLQAIRRFCDVNSIGVDPALEQKVTEFMCGRLPDGVCTGPGARGALSVSLSRVKDVTRLLVRRALSSGGSFLTSLPDANARARVCVECPLNANTSCTTCNGLLQTARQLVGRRETPYDQYLGTCQLCGCMLRVKVHVSGSALAASTTPPRKESVPANCWLRGVYNYK